MTPAERILAALRRQEVDYAPCLPFFWSSPTVPEYAWENEEGRLDVHVNRLGVDAFVSFGVGLERHPDVTERTWEERIPTSPNAPGRSVCPASAIRSCTRSLRRPPAN